MLEVAHAFKHDGVRPKRSVMFLAVTAEEKGLLGSEYYADSPLYPLGKTVAVLNMDGVNLLGRAKDITMSGDAPLTLQDDMVRVAAKYGMTFTPDPNPQAGSFYRSDHFPFAKRGVPAISFGAGQNLENGGVAAGKAASEAYTRDKYHQPADEFDPNWDMSGAIQEISVFHDLGAELANSTRWPEWKPGAEFKEARDQTKAERK